MVHAQRVCTKTVVADLRLAEDLKQLIVGQEIKAAEPRSLGFQVVAQALLHHIQQLGTLAELVQQFRVVAELDASEGTMRVGQQVTHKRCFDGSRFREVRQPLLVVLLALSSTRYRLSYASLRPPKASGIVVYHIDIETHRAPPPADIMVALQCLSTLEKRLPSAGSCLLMSSESKIGCK